jgi:hypothetical protein
MKYTNGELITGGMGKATGDSMDDWMKKAKEGARKKAHQMIKDGATEVKIYIEFAGNLWWPLGNWAEPNLQDEETITDP